MCQFIQMTFQSLVTIFKGISISFLDTVFKFMVAIIFASFALLYLTDYRQHLEAYLEKIPLESEKKALKVMRLCEKYGFTEQSRFHLIRKIIGFYDLY